MSNPHRKEALEQISSGLKLKFLEFMKLYGKNGFPPELDVSTKGFSAAKTSSKSFKESKGTTSTMEPSSTSFKEDEIQDDLEVLSSSSSSDESDEGQDISDLQLGPLELKEPTEQVSNHIDETESSSSEMAALEDLVVEEAERDTPKKRAYGCTGMKGVSRRIDSKTGTVSYQAWHGFWICFFWRILLQAKCHPCHVENYLAPATRKNSQGGLAKSQLLGPWYINHDKPSGIGVVPSTFLVRYKYKRYPKIDCWRAERSQLKLLIPLSWVVTRCIQRARRSFQGWNTKNMPGALRNGTLY